MAEGGAAVQQARLQPRHLSGGLRQVGVQLSSGHSALTVCNDIFQGGRGRPTASFVESVDSGLK